MKNVSASEARKRWFRLLDEVAGGEVVVIERNGQRILLTREKPRRGAKAVPDYRKLLRGRDIDQADEWTWDWEPDTGLAPSRSRRR